MYRPCRLQARPDDTGTLSQVLMSSSGLRWAHSSGLSSQDVQLVAPQSNTAAALEESMHDFDFQSHKSYESWAMWTNYRWSYVGLGQSQDFGLEVDV